MKYNIPRKVAVCLALAATALLVSCPSPFNNTDNGTITLRFSGTPRNIEIPIVADPTLAIATVRVEVTGAGMEKLISQPVVYASIGTTLTISIPAGPDRVVTVLALNATGTTLYSQAKTVNIVAGKDLRVSFNLEGIVYSISFDANGGTGTMDPQSIAYGSKVALKPNSFTKEGHYFVGWAISATTNANYADEAEYTMGSPNAILYAVWAANNTVAFNANGDGVLGSMVNQEIATDATLNLTANSFTREGYTFEGWALSSEGGVDYYDEDEFTMGPISTVLYAVWETIPYTITYNLDGGSSTNPATFTIESSIIPLNDPIKPGFIFSGWFDNPGLTGVAITTIPTGSTGDKSLWAKWSTGQYIQGDASGGGGGGATGAHLGGTGGAGGGGDDTLAGTAGNDIIFGDGSGGGKGGRGIGLEDNTGIGAGPGGGGADSINGGAGDDIIFGDGFNGTMNQWNCGYGGFGGGGGGGSGAFLGGYLGEFGGLGGGSGSGYAGSKSPLISGFGYAGGSGNTPGGNSATSVSPTTTGLGGLSYGSTNNGHGGGGGFGGSSGGAGASTTGPGNPGQDGNTDEHRYDDTSGAIYTYVLGRLATILTDYPNYGAGNDTLDGGPGSDHLFGLGGNDTFVFELDDAYNGNDIDTIWDFNVSGTDMLSLKIGSVPINMTVRDALIVAQITDGTDRKLVFSDGINKQVTIVIKNLNRDIVAVDFQ